MTDDACYGWWAMGDGRPWTVALWDGGTVEVWRMEG